MLLQKKKQKLNGCFHSINKNKNFRILVLYINNNFSFNLYLIV